MLEKRTGVNMALGRVYPLTLTGYRKISKWHSTVLVLARQHEIEKMAPVSVSVPREHLIPAPWSGLITSQAIRLTSSTWQPPQLGSTVVSWASPNL